MNKKALVGIAAGIAALGMLVSGSTANAGSTSSDWYKNKTCFAKYGTGTSSVANLQISNYDDPQGTGQIYHIDADGSSSLDVYRVYANGVAFTVTNDFYWRDSNPRDLNDFAATWYSPLGTQWGCSIKDF